MEQTPSRRRRRPLRVLGVVVALLALGAALPPVRDRVSAAAALAEAVGVAVPRPFAADVDRRAVDLAGRPADLYDAGEGSPGVLLVPGAAPAGRADPRVQDLALALARSRVSVLVPELELYDHRFVESDLETLVAGVRMLRDRSPHRDVTVLGFSFGGSLALVAAADPRVAAEVGTVATFGAYADMTGMIQAAATGVSVVDGRRHPWDPPPGATDALHRLAVEVTPAAERDALAAALDRGEGAGDLPPAAAAAYALVTVEDPDKVDERVAALPPDSRGALLRFSPAAVADRLRAHVLALHSRDDPAVPYAELERMTLLFPGARGYTVESFEHVDLRTDTGLGPLVRDLLTAWRFAGDVLAAAR